MSARQSTRSKYWVADFWIHAPNGLPKKVKRESNYEGKKFLTKKQAEIFEQDELAKDRERQRTYKYSSEHPETTRTVANMIEWYQSLLRYTELRESTKIRYQKLISVIVKWCESKGITYLIEFSEEKALQFEGYVYSKYKRKGRVHLIAMCKILFKEEMKRKPRSLEENPFESIKIPKILPTEPRFLTITELKLFFSQCSEYEYHVFRLFVRTGLRTDEYLSLPRTHVSANNIRITTYKDFEPKTFKGRRTIPLSNEAKESLDYLLKNGNVGEYLISDEKGGKRSEYYLKTITRRIAKHLMKKGTPIHGLTPHVFRRTFGSMLLQSGVSLSVVSDLMGHMNESTTRRIYAALLTENLEAGIEKLNDTIL